MEIYNFFYNLSELRTHVYFIRFEKRPLPPVSESSVYFFIIASILRITIEILHFFLVNRSPVPRGANFFCVSAAEKNKTNKTILKF